MKGAQALARKQAHKETDISTVAERSKLEDDVPDDEEDGQRRRKRPKRSAKFFIQDVITFNAQKTSRPYNWAQHLAGIDFLPEVSPLLPTENNEAARSQDVIFGLSL
ncbi:hypothetical protein KIW84_024987 [Lathyrus oleraceus]|uniref:Uncharacterized protein n=1 Tax=Pisum sativum TaxID=3888 RepID=A0A9D5BD81_PEA|nr:hypothetical protein KIW84_024987 [Pisum sativum]